MMPISCLQGEEFNIHARHCSSLDVNVRSPVFEDSSQEQKALISSIKVEGQIRALCNPRPHQRQDDKRTPGKKVPTGLIKNTLGLRLQFRPFGWRRFSPNWEYQGSAEWTKLSCPGFILKWAKQIYVFGSYLKSRQCISGVFMESL